MSGTSEGAKKGVKTREARYSKKQIAKWQSKGGKAKTSKLKGFAAMSPEKRRAAGRKGGLAKHKIDGMAYEYDI